MGGSILGAEAINCFLGKPKKKISFSSITSMKNKYQILKKGKFEQNTFLIISKSGNTIETLANVATLNILKKMQKI